MARPAFPKNLIEFQARFSSTESCFEFLRDARWPEGFKCPACGAGKSYPRQDSKALECSGCGKITSVTAGTVMHRSKIPLQAWLWTAWLMVSSKSGISALELSRQIGVNRETAFALLHKLRHAMVAPERTLLTGTVEVDEAYVGASDRGRKGPGGTGKSVVVGAVEVRDGRPARIRLRVLESATAEALGLFLRDNVEPGARVITDGNVAYTRIAGYKHTRVIAGRDGAEQDDVLPYFHTAISNLKAWLAGTHHGAVKDWHLQGYLDEFCYRYNRRDNLGAAFGRLFELTPTVGKLTYEALYAKGDKVKSRALRRKEGEK